MRGLLLAVLAAFLLMPTALALDQTGDPLLNQEEVYQEQHQTLGMDELEEVGEAYTGQETVGEDLDCSGLPVTGETVCNYDEGFLAGILKVYTKKDYVVTEVDCWATGSRVCRFEANVKKTGESGNE